MPTNQSLVDHRHAVRVVAGLVQHPRWPDHRGLGEDHPVVAAKRGQPFCQRLFASEHTGHVMPVGAIGITQLPLKVP